MPQECDRWRQQSRHLAREGRETVTGGGSKGSPGEHVRHCRDLSAPQTSQPSRSSHTLPAGISKVYLQIVKNGMSPSPDTKPTSGNNCIDHQLHRPLDASMTLLVADGNRMKRCCQSKTSSRTSFRKPPMAASHSNSPFRKPPMAASHSNSPFRKPPMAASHLNSLSRKPPRTASHLNSLSRKPLMVVSHLNSLSRRAARCSVRLRMRSISAG